MNSQRHYGPIVKNGKPVGAWKCDICGEVDLTECGKSFDCYSTNCCSCCKELNLIGDCPKKEI